MDTLLPMRQDGPIFLYNKDAFTTFLRGPVTKRTASEQYDPDGEQEGKRSLRYSGALGHSRRTVVVGVLQLLLRVDASDL